MKTYQLVFCYLSFNNSFLSRFCPRFCLYFGDWVRDAVLKSDRAIAQSNSGLVVTGGDSCPEGCRFKSQHCILHGHLTCSPKHLPKLHLLDQINTNFVD